MSETPFPKASPLKYLAAKLQDNHEFMAWVVATYQRKEHINNDQIIAQLKTTPEMLVRLALCKCPNSDSMAFASQVREIANYTNIDPVILANIIRQVNSLDAFSKLPRKSAELNGSARKLAPGLLAAARDKIENEEIENRETNNQSQDITGGDDVAR
jgi:hypothetical protein